MNDLDGDVHANRAIAPLPSQLPHGSVQWTACPTRCMLQEDISERDTEALFLIATAIFRDTAKAIGHRLNMRNFWFGILSGTGVRTGDTRDRVSFTPSGCVCPTCPPPFRRSPLALGRALHFMQRLAALIGWPNPAGALASWLSLPSDRPG